MSRKAWIALSLVFFAFQAPADTSQAEATALAAAQSWLALVDAGAYGESWENAAQLFRDAVTAQQWEQSVKAARVPLGAVVRRSEMSKTYATSMPGAPDGEYVVIQFSTSFAHKASAVETVTPMLDKDGEWRVAGYFVR